MKESEVKDRLLHDYMKVTNRLHEDLVRVDVIAQQVRTPERIGVLCDELDIENRRLTNINTEISGYVKKIIGVMYHGVLIDKKVTIRNGKCYYYRCQSQIGTDSLKTNLLEHQEEVLKKLGQEKWDLILELLPITKNKESNCVEWYLDKPEIIVDYTNSPRVQQYVVENVKVDFGGILLNDGRNVGSTAKIIFYCLHEQKIVEMLEQTLTEIRECNKITENSIEQIKTLGSKYLIIAKFREGER